jgi:hypothetical protein
MLYNNQISIYLAYIGARVDSVAWICIFKPFISEVNLESRLSVKEVRNFLADGFVNAEDGCINMSKVLSKYSLPETVFRHDLLWNEILVDHKASLDR